jgi:ribonuclease M5
MNQNKLNLTQALVVEGKYDAARLANLVDATILTTDGFAIFKDKTMQALFKRIAAAQGMILLTDSDAAGFISPPCPVRNPANRNPARRACLAWKVWTMP